MLSELNPDMAQDPDRQALNVDPNPDLDPLKLCRSDRIRSTLPKFPIFVLPDSTWTFLWTIKNTKCCQIGTGTGTKPANITCRIWHWIFFESPLNLWQIVRIRLRVRIRNNRITDPNPGGNLITNPQDPDQDPQRWVKNLRNLKQNFFVLQDQYDQIAVHTQKGIDFLEKYGNFVDQRCKIEQEYATKLRYVGTSALHSGDRISCRRGLSTYRDGFLHRHCKEKLLVLYR
jgi:hypothetical protein